GTSICQGLDLYHDAEEPTLHWAQTSSARDVWRFSLTSYGFEGSFCSLACAVAADQAHMLRTSDILRLTLIAESSRPVALHARLNIAEESDKETLHAHRVLDHGRHDIRFPLEATQLDFDAGADIWIDLILARPRMLELHLSAVRLDLAASEADGEAGGE
ncbi:MAG: DUF6478 family protein, partial [Pseudomonadota bacterium]